jgi:hypothetical protein
MVVQKKHCRKDRREITPKIPGKNMVCGPNRADVPMEPVFSAHQPKMGAMTDAAWFLEDDPQSARRVAIRADISRRLRRICPHYSDEEFSDLVDSMTQRQLDGERRANRLAD